MKKRPRIADVRHLVHSLSDLYTLPSNRKLSERQWLAIIRLRQITHQYLSIGRPSSITMRRIMHDMECEREYQEDSDLVRGCHPTVAQILTVACEELEAFLAEAGVTPPSYLPKSIPVTDPLTWCAADALLLYAQWRKTKNHGKKDSIALMLGICLAELDSHVPCDSDIQLSRQKGADRNKADSELYRSILLYYMKCAKGATKFDRAHDAMRLLKEVLPDNENDWTTSRRARLRKYFRDTTYRSFLKLAKKDYTS